VHFTPDQVREKASASEYGILAGSSMMGVSCTYLGEVLATVVLFRDGKVPFTDDDAAALKLISPIFATSLSSIVRDEDEEGDDHGGGGSVLDGSGDDDKPSDGDKPRKKGNKSDADWWKRGEAPPF